MNTIPVTFDENQINRTIIGGQTEIKKDSLNISVILLNSSSSNFRLNLFENLMSCNFQSIVSIENNAENYSIDDISKAFPAVKFIIPLENSTLGELINIAMSEVQSDFVLVLSDNLYIPSGVILPHLAERLVKDDIFCLVPRLLDKNQNTITNQYRPNAEKTHFEIDTSSVTSDGIKTLYPYDYIGIYNRKKLIQLGGFAYSIRTPFWQILDLFVRSWLWGEETHITTLLKFSYFEDYPLEDRTITYDYLRYYLKNELPKYKNDHGVIPNSAFYKFIRNSSCGYLEARRQFKDAQNWVDKNKYKYKMDLKMLIENWSNV